MAPRQGLKDRPSAGAGRDIRRTRASVVPPCPPTDDYPARPAVSLGICVGGAAYVFQRVVAAVHGRASKMAACMRTHEND
jgi:hypothetical protein